MEEPAASRVAGASAGRAGKGASTAGAGAPIWARQPGHKTQPVRDVRDSTFMRATSHRLLCSHVIRQARGQRSSEQAKYRCPSKTRELTHKTQEGQLPGQRLLNDPS